MLNRGVFLIDIGLLKSIRDNKNVITESVSDDTIFFEDDNYLSYYSIVKANDEIENVHDFVLFMIFDSRVSSDIRLKSLRELIHSVIMKTQTDVGLARLCDAIWSVTYEFSIYIDKALSNTFDFFDNEHIFGVMPIEDFHNAMKKAKTDKNYTAELLDGMNYSNAEFFYTSEDCPLNFVPEYLALVDSFNGKNVFDNLESIISQIFKENIPFFTVKE